ncbi:MAG: alpha/beta hydrolase [Saprospiraceae bacterium]|nr:alpha/beta hydrolase [Saprospiraceae bacterium]
MIRKQKSTDLLKLTPSLEIGYSDIGKGNSTLLFVHGLGSTKEIWLRNTQSIAKTSRCICIDLPGYGQSSTVDLDYTLPYYAQVILACIAKLALKKVTLIGHSMGAQIAIMAALKKPRLFEKLVLISPSGFESFSSNEKEWLRKIYHADFLKMLSVEQFSNSIQSNFLNFTEQDMKFKKDYQKIYQSHDFPRYCHTLSFNVNSMLNEEVLDQLSELRMPVLILFGQQDQMIPNRFLHPQLSTLQIARSGQEKIKNSQLKMIPDAGHFVHWEQADEVNQSIIDFQN